jgi:predicted house-cleaning noncanonical NTP pyrophosphatase (MazG superfamily)
VVSGEDLVEALHRKLEEESLELRQASEVDVREESADVFEVLLSLAAVHGMSWSKIESAAAEKRVRRGGFSRGIWLLE